MKARENALIILNKIEKESLYANLELKNSLICEEKDKTLAVEIIYGVLRYKLNLDYVISQYSKLKFSKLSLTVKNILRLSLYQILYLDRIPKSAACNEGVKLTRKYSHKGSVSFVNAILRKVSDIDKNEISYPTDRKEYLKYKYSFPENITEIFIRDYGVDKTEELLTQLNVNKGVCIRPNLTKISFSELAEILDENEILYKTVEGKAFIIHKRNKIIDEFFAEGLCSIQDRASMKVVELLNPQKGDKILDVCAAPGGKSCYIAEMTGDECKIVSCDIHKHRVELIKKNAQRLSLKSINAIVLDGTESNRSFFGQFDKILLDAPCSGLGVIAKKPDIKWSGKDYDCLNEIQRKIIDNVSFYLKPGGVLVYSTCTINKTENEDIINGFLNNHKDFRLVGNCVQLMPCEEYDGFFMCCLERINNGKDKA